LSSPRWDTPLHGARPSFSKEHVAKPLNIGLLATSEIWRIFGEDRPVPLRLGPPRGQQAFVACHRRALSPNTVHLSVAQAVKPAEPRFISAFFSFPRDSSPSATMSHGSTAASPSPRMGGRQGPVGHVASLREPATRALPAAKQTECGTSLCLEGPISRLRPWWTALLETTAHRATGSGFHPLRPPGC